MRYVILIVLALSMLLLPSCQKGKINALNATIDSLRTENAQLIEENNNITLYVDEVNKLIETVNTNLDSIAKMETDLQNMPKNVAPGKIGEQLKAKLGMIGQYIVNSKDKINNLEKQLASAKFDIKGLKMLVADLKNKLQDKETEVLNLMEEKGMLQADIQRMGEDLKSKDEKIATQEATIVEANKRYYIIGKEDELQRKGIIQKTGGFLTLGKVAKVSPDLSLQDFATVDGTMPFEIDIPYKKDKLKIVSPHEMVSYELIGNGNQTTLRILDPAKFWEESKVLVVAVS